MRDERDPWLRNGSWSEEKSQERQNQQDQHNHQ